VLKSLTLSVGRDYKTTTRFEFVLFSGEQIIAREGHFKTSSGARRAGLRAAQAELGGKP
jgi:hypothetical protein